MSDPIIPGPSPPIRQTRGPLAAPGAVAAGGLLGSAARAAVSTGAPTLGAFPVATLLVNLAGSFALGVYLGRRQRAVVGRWSLQFWAIGALGSFTTFSAFSFEVFRLVDVGSAATAVGYVAASTIGGLAAALAGDRVGRVSG